MKRQSQKVYLLTLFNTNTSNATLPKSGFVLKRGAVLMSQPFDTKPCDVSIFAFLVWFCVSPDVKVRD